MKELSREEVQRVETKLLEEFADICESHGLSYYLAYGTLIGAARHQGFIPWDDDVDVMMPRKDFEILFSEFNGWRLRDTSQFVHCRNETCRFPFARIMDTRTLVDEEYSEGEEELGAWIDIFPLDDMPLDADKLFKRIGYWNTARMLAASDPKKGATPFARLAKKILVPCYRGNSLCQEDGPRCFGLGQPRPIKLRGDPWHYRAREAATKSMVRTSSSAVWRPRILRSSLL